MRAWMPIILLASLTLAGCAGSSGTESDPGAGSGDLQVTDDTGGIRGVVVDSAITPVLGVLVTLAGGQNMTTGEDGLFNFTGLPAGEYFIQAGKAGYKAATTVAVVVAGVADPPVVRILVERLSALEPYFVPFRLDGFYECGFSMSFITDSCDFGYRTAYDAAHPPVVPRTVLKFSNTQFIDVGSDEFTIIQEGFWKSDSVPEFIVMVDSTPIDNGCDCSDTYQNVQGPPGVINRIEKFLPDGSLNNEFRNDLGFGGVVGEFPVDVTVAARGFLPPISPYSYAVNMQFTVMTTMFHNYVPDPAWTFETRDQYPVG